MSLELIFLILTLFTCGGISLFLFSLKRNTDSIHKQINNGIYNVHINAMYPTFYKYQNNFSDISQCEKCGLTGLIQDHNTSCPCINCGGEVKEIGLGKYIQSRNVWIQRPSV